MDNDQVSLNDKTCIPCSGKEPPLKGDDLLRYMARLPSPWSVVEEHHLVKTFKFKDFKSALAFTNAVGAVAETEGHHPLIELTWGRVAITIWTHKINGLSENDFILASKIDLIFHTNGG